MRPFKILWPSWLDCLGVMFNCTTYIETIGEKKEKTPEINLFSGTEITNLNV